MERLQEFLFTLFGQLAAQSALEWLAVLLALGYVWLAARQSIWCWPCALVSTGIYSWLFWRVSLPFHTVLNGYYLLMAVYGWVCWRRQGDDRLPVRQLALRSHLLLIPALLLVAVGLATLARQWFSSDYVYLDAIITVFSLFTTVLVARKVLENWLYWLAINSWSAYLYFATGLYPTAVLFVCYLGFAVYGYWQWRRDMLQQKPVADACHAQ